MSEFDSDFSSADFPSLVVAAVTLDGLLLLPAPMMEFLALPEAPEES